VAGEVVVAPGRADEPPADVEQGGRIDLVELGDEPIDLDQRLLGTGHGDHPTPFA
jgi:hypothetical protein